MQARSEPLLWVQLIGGGLFPLEALLLLLLLAGADPGPVPALERLLSWALGGLLPLVVLWHRPADVWSLLLLQTPLRGRRPLQQKLSRLQDNRLLRLAFALGAALSLPLLWWLDDHAAIATPISPLADAPRLVVLLLASALLAVMLWQWQQLLQALWLLNRSPGELAETRPLSLPELEEQRLCLGLPLLLLHPLGGEDAGRAAKRSRPAAGSSSRGSERPPEPAPMPPTEHPLSDQAGESQPSATEKADGAPADARANPPRQEAEEAASTAPPPTTPPPSTAGLHQEASAAVRAAAIDDEQASADNQGDTLDQQVP